MVLVRVFKLFKEFFLLNKLLVIVMRMVVFVVSFLILMVDLKGNEVVVVK